MRLLSFLEQGAMGEVAALWAKSRHLALSQWRSEQGRQSCEIRGRIENSPLPNFQIADILWKKKRAVDA